MMDRIGARGLLLAIFTALCGAVGIACMKLGVRQEPVVLPVFAAGLAVYGVGMVAGIALLAKFPISIAYPVVVGLSLVLLVFVSASWLGETLTPARLLGTALILVGVVFLAGSGAQYSTKRNAARVD